MSNPLSHFEHGVAKPVDGCQCCLCRVAFPNTHGAADFFWDHHASEIIDPTDNSGCFHSCLQLGIFLGLVLLLVVSPLFIPRWFRKNKENRNSAFSFLSVAHVELPLGEMQKMFLTARKSYNCFGTTKKPPGYETEWL